MRRVALAVILAVAFVCCACLPQVAWAQSAARPYDDVGGSSVVRDAKARGLIPFATEHAAESSNATAEVSAEQTGSGVDWTRLGGSNRYETMGLIVEAAFDASEWAVVATGESFADTLAASALAGAHDCPLLLTKPSELSKETRAQIARLGVKHVCIVGGEGSVGRSVESSLASLGVDVVRYGGRDRQATSVQVYQAVREADDKAGRKRSDTVVVATGESYADALCMGPWSFAAHAPILLADASGRLSDEAVQAIKGDAAVVRVVVVGGTGALGDEVASQLGTGYIIERLGGANAYQTSALVAEWEVRSGLSWNAPVVASGTNFPDALAGAVLAGRKGSVLLFADELESPSLAVLHANASQVNTGFLLGGERSMPLHDPLAPTIRSSLEAASAAPETVSFGGYHASQGVLDRVDQAIVKLHGHGYAVGFILMDLSSHQGVAYDCDALFYGASSIKAPYIASVVAQHPEAVITHQYDMQETLFYSWDFNYKEVLAAYGSEPMKAWCAWSGARPSIAESLPWAIYSARDLALMWGQMYLLFSQCPEGETLGTWCERPNESTIHDALGGAYRTRSKAGWVNGGGELLLDPLVNNGGPIYEVSIDGGIVYAPNGTYVVAIMSNVPANQAMLNELTLALDAAHNEMMETPLD